MPEVSITLPSLRREAVLRVIKEFSRTNGNIDYEIIVVSPFVVKEDRVVHIYEDKAIGSVRAQNVAYENSSGKYVMYWSDDFHPTTNCISNMLEFVKCHIDPFIGAFRVEERGQEARQWCVYNRLYACFGFLSRNTINLIGGYLDTAYASHWADPDMGIRTWEKGGEVKICPNAWVVAEQIADELVKDTWNKYFEKDKETFLDRWHNKLGKGIDRCLVSKDWSIINRHF